MNYEKAKRMMELSDLNTQAQDFIEARIAALTAENAKLREALAEIISQIDQGGNSGKVLARDHCIISARALLEAK